MYKKFFEELKANPGTAIANAYKGLDKNDQTGHMIIEKVDEIFLCEGTDNYDVLFLEDNVYGLAFDNAMYIFLITEDKTFTFNEKVHLAAEAAEAAKTTEVERFYFYTFSLNNMNVYGEESY